MAVARGRGACLRKHLSKWKFFGSSQPPVHEGAGENVGAIDAPLYSTQEPPRSGLNTLYKSIRFKNNPKHPPSGQNPDAPTATPDGYNDRQ